MISRDIKSLMNRVGGPMNVALEAAAGFSISKTHYEVFPDHLITKLLEEGSGDIPLILKHYDIDLDKLWEQINRKLDRFAAGNTGRPRFSRDLVELLESAWVISSLHYDQQKIRSGALIEIFLDDARYSDSPLADAIESIEAKTLQKEFFEIVKDSSENIIESVSRGGEPFDKAAARPGGRSALELYTIDMTGNAAAGEIDPVFGRDKEIRQVIDILSRRRKNNPMLVGEAGVGKTAVVEGLAVMIAQGDVIDSLKGTELRGLDLGMLQAGAGVKGEFENRLKGVINEVIEASPRIMLFIDEAHTLIGAGGSAGVGDAANLLKPALARGKLRTIGATTFSEYKKYIEKDPALERRFQMVKIDEPDEETGIIMLRGIKKIYEEHHKLVITDNAVRAAVSLSNRYIAGRQLPDKAVDVLDTSAARVKMTATGKPKKLELLERQLEYAERRLTSLERDAAEGYTDEKREIEDAKEDLAKVKVDIKETEKRWKEQKVVGDEIDKLKKQLHKKPGVGDDTEKVEAKGKSDSKKAKSKKSKPVKDADVAKKLIKLRKKLHELQGDEPLVLADVDAAVVGTVVADWTGIPVGRMVKDQAGALLDFEKIVGKSIIGQDEALTEIANSIRVTKSGMGKQDNPIGVFMFVGPSGVGKTETARFTAETLFGGERFMTTINMSEYQEKHTVSQLKGSPPGYVGYGEGGILTEAVRRRPYSVVLLDEVEKADREVMNLFYQVFDRGFMRDGEGREIDFKNTIIMMTSNLGSDEMMDAVSGDKLPNAEEMSEIIRPILLDYFQAALLARIKVIPFFPLSSDAIRKIVTLKLGALGKRLGEAHRIALDYKDDIVDNIAEQCTRADTGARNIDYIIERNLLPDISKSLVEMLADEEMPEKLVLFKGDDNMIGFEFK